MFKLTLRAFVTAIKGLGVTLKHLFGARKSRGQRDVRNADYFDKQDGVTTIQYPRQEIPMPEVARYQLDVEIDDCIVCDLCAKACPLQNKRSPVLVLSNITLPRGAKAL